MARLPYLDAQDLAEEDRALLARPANLFRAYVHSPEAFRNFSRLGGYIRSRSTLDPRLRELAILQVGYLTRAEYEYTHHIQLGRDQFGVSDEDIRAIAAETSGEDSGLPDLDRAVLRLAREMTDELQGNEADVRDRPRRARPGAHRRPDHDDRLLLHGGARPPHARHRPRG